MKDQVTSIVTTRWSWEQIHKNIFEYGFAISYRKDEIN